MEMCFKCRNKCYVINMKQRLWHGRTDSPDMSLGARNIYHQLLMNSLLMDLKYKKSFAIQFAKVTHLVHWSDLFKISLCYVFRR